MSRLLASEASRFFSRRLVRLFGLLVILAIVVAGIVTFAKSHRSGVAELQREAEVRRARQLELCRSGKFEISEGEIPPGQTLDQYCEMILPTSVFYQDPRFHLRVIGSVFKGMTAPLVLIAMVLAASFAGAEWHAGTVTTLLTWEPRRIRVILAKLLVCILVAFVGAILIQALLGAALVPAAAFRGSTEGMSWPWIRDVAGVLLRSGVLTAIGAAIAFSIAFIFRNSAAALGVGFGYLIVFENLLGGLRPGIARWLFTWNAIVFIGAGDAADVIPGRTAEEAVLLLGAYAVAAIVAATLLFRARDVT